VGSWVFLRDFTGSITTPQLSLLHFALLASFSMTHEAPLSHQGKLCSMASHAPYCPLPTALPENQDFSLSLGVRLSNLTCCKLWQ
jgi:hypothetical protein